MVFWISRSVSKITAIVFTALLCAIPLTALAFPFGGQIIRIVNPCRNGVVWAQLSAPVPGPYIWTPATKTYQFGRPTHVGQWLLGLTGVPYNCLVTVNPVYTEEGITISMMGSSGPAAPVFSSNGINPFSASGVNLGSGSGQGVSPGSSGAFSGSTPIQLPVGVSPAVPSSPIIGHVVISEVYYNVDPSHGNDPQNEWVELYNGSTSVVDISGWIIVDLATERTIPQGTLIQSNSFLLVTADSQTKSKWNIPGNIPVITLSGLIGDGLLNAGDALSLKQGSQVVDSLSWGTNTSVFNPALSSLSSGHSFARGSLTKDTHSTSDWIDLMTPLPGK